MKKALILTVAFLSFIFCSAQPARVKEVKFIYPEYVLVGLTEERFNEEMKKLKMHPIRSLTDSSYSLSVDARVGKKMYLSAYEYFFKHDTCYTIRIRSGLFNSQWKDEILKDHDFNMDESRETKRQTLHKYISKDKRYKLIVYEQTEYNAPAYSMQAWKN